MKTIEWKVALTKDNQIASIETRNELPLDKLESHLIIIGILEQLKANHQSKIGILKEASYKQGKDELDL